MKKFLVCFMFIFLMATTVFAETYSVEFSKDEHIKGVGMIAQFDENGRAVWTSEVELLKGETYKTEAELPLDNKNIRIYFPESETIIKDFLKIEKKQVAEEPRYPREIDQVTAFMMVKNVTTVVVDDEVLVQFQTFFNGKEIDFYAKEDMKILSAPIKNSSLTGESVEKLKKGDIIYCTANSNGNARSVELIYRPIETDISRSGEDYGDDFEKLFTLGNDVTSEYPVPYIEYGSNSVLKHQYAFGIIKDYKIGEYITLINKAGISLDELTFDINKNVVVYVYDSKTKNKVSIGSASDISSSFIYSGDVDDNDNIIRWSDTSVCNYALVRVGKGCVLDIAVFVNCNK